MLQLLILFCKDAVLVLCLLLVGRVSAEGVIDFVGVVLFRGDCGAVVEVVLFGAHASIHIHFLKL